jgi:hypothetical protein
LRPHDAWCQPKREEPAPAQGGSTIEFDTGRGGSGQFLRVVGWSERVKTKISNRPVSWSTNWPSWPSCSPLVHPPTCMRRPHPRRIRYRVTSEMKHLKSLFAVLHLLRPNCTEFIRKALRTSYLYALLEARRVGSCADAGAGARLTSFPRVAVGRKPSEMNRVRCLGVFDELRHYRCFSRPEPCEWAFAGSRR